MSFNIEVEGGSSVRLPTAGKYCDRDIIVKALGGGEGGIICDMGEFVLDTDEQFSQNNTESRQVPHGLGAKPDFVMVWTDDLVGVTNPDTVYATWAGFIWLNQWMGLENWGTNAAKFPGTTIAFHQNKASDNMGIVKPTSQTYALDESYVSASYFMLCYNRNVLYRAGLTYRYFVAKAWWNVGGESNAE